MTIHELQRLAADRATAQLFERSEFAMEIGAAINVCPNAARILSYYEFNFDSAVPSTVEEVSRTDVAMPAIVPSLTRSLSIISHSPFAPCPISHPPADLVFFSST